jgi:hypothetical protein
LGIEKNEQLRYYTEFKIVKDTIKKLNPEFSLCTILVAYHGDNRNRSSISKEVFDENLWSIYGIPIIGEWVRREEDQNKQTWGSHGGRIILDAEGIRFEQTTKPFGFITEKAYQNASWVEILEKDGHTKHEYIKLENCVLWSGRYEECESILEENFGQSMEINVIDGFYREDDYFEITKFSFSALCILGTAEPCFESAMIGRQYELNRFKQEYQLMMDEFKKLNPDDISSDLNIRVNAPQENFKKEGEVQLGENILFTDVCAKIKLLMSETTYRSRTGKQYEKYIVLSTDESKKSIVVVDREDNYVAYAVPYIATQTKEGLVVTIDYENKTALVIGGVENTDSKFNINEEVSLIAKDVSEYDVGVYSSNRINELLLKLEEATSNFESASNEVDTLKKQLEIFEGEKKQFMVQKHKEIIDTLVASRREKLGKFSEFLDFCIDIDYSKSVDQVETALKEIDYNFMSKYWPDNKKKSFSAITTEVSGSGDGATSESGTIAERYGEDIAKYFK